MFGARKWLSSSLIFLLVSTAFSTVLVYSIPAEDPFVPSLPEIPPPRAENREALYRSLMQQKRMESSQTQTQTQETQQEKAPAEQDPAADSRESPPASEDASGFPDNGNAADSARTEDAKSDVSPAPADPIKVPGPQKPNTHSKKSPEGDRQQDQKRFVEDRQSIATRLSRDAVDQARRAFQQSQPSVQDNPETRSHNTTKQDREAIQKALPDASVDPLLKGIEPLQNRQYRFTAPAYYKGIYLNNYVARTASRYRPLLKQARETGINTLVVDVQPHLPPEQFMKEARDQGFYLVSRVVVFQGGLKTYPAPAGHVEKILKRAEESARHGFMEVQLDYIRFADKLHIRGLTLPRRYRTIASILHSFEKRLRPHGVRIGADIFGRIPFNQNDIIGQKMEIFAPYMDTLYPMLYPSHFYGDPHYQKNPYKTIYDGKTRAIRRAGTSRVIAYIQGFTMLVGKSGLSYKDYIKKQILAARDSGGAGFIVWNPKNDYQVFFQALKETN